MADQNSYLAYKRDTRQLLFWMIHASNSIIKSSIPSPAAGIDGAPTTVNTTGQITVASMVPMASLVAKYIKPIPSTIYRLFESVIAARKASHAIFQQIAAQKPDPEIEKSNMSHRIFIDALTKAFAALGGNSWRSEKMAETTHLQRTQTMSYSRMHFPLSVLVLKQSGGKKKKGKKGKKVKGKAKAPIQEASLDDVPLESYRIIEGQEGLVTDYLMAVYSVASQWVELRGYVQALWRQVAYGGLNSAVGGSMSNVAIAMIKKTEAAIFVEFPGHDSFQTIMNTITRGDPGKVQGMFHVSLARSKNGGAYEEVKEVDVDVNEHFMIHAYQDLLDFIKDFQHTRSGKPTKTMLAEIRDWDPTFDLERATKQQRIKWRRSFTINWLYDLVNVFSAIVVQRNTMKGQKWVMENVDWSMKGPWNQHRRLFGLNEFASIITTLAMQKPGTDVRPKIAPSCVFQLQCIVDSLAVFRGWSICGLQGHILIPPAAAFRPRRDVDLFLDRQNERPPNGYCSAVDLLRQVMEKDAILHGHFDRHESTSSLLKDFSEDFVNWLGETKYLYGLTTIPHSRFSHTNANGLWEYSPFLCGVGLMEALELTYDTGMMLWDSIPEPVCAIHLHNMSVQKGLITKPIGLFATIEDLFSTDFFAEGKAPNSNFQEALLAVMKPSSRRSVYDRRAARRTIARTATDIHGLLDPSTNRFFKQKSLLRIYRDAGCQTKEVTDPATGKKALQRTFLVNQALARGIDEQDLMSFSSIPEALLPPLPERYSRAPSLTFGRTAGGNKVLASERELLNLLQVDIMSDIGSEVRPLSSLNYIFVTIRFMMVFMQIEERLKALRNPVWVQAYEQDPTMMKEKRASLTVLALAGGDEECLRVMAEVFEKSRSGSINHIYWDDLENPEKTKAKDPLEHLPDFGCTLM
ncbi:uncharacterized protein LY89DRAFT_731741 [Mollisia scopiformis]|uniref:DUF6604 domain-containing protein n=1 Tax=Mollisia scopiformis TaxID=149040 RepID=A0A194XGT2_MOLSC|nr:uncharacterized protein LY89DRAFT_731741 [Mollisia scopiformis]KUJ19339.1 hypothetical protein LY89DRAFT_731741 [Mollisia scopiformis]